jgi:hypothetical protein
MPGSDSGSTSGAGGSNGTTNQAIAPASTIRKRGGTKPAPNAGATIRQAAIRKNGQIQSPSHP